MPRDADPAPREHSSLTPCAGGFEPFILPAGSLVSQRQPIPTAVSEPVYHRVDGDHGADGLVSFLTEGIISSLLVKSLYMPRNHRGAEELLGEEQGTRPVASAQASACGIQVWPEQVIALIWL